MPLKKSIQDFRGRQPGHPLTRILWWHFCHALCVVWFAVCYRFRFFGQHHIPKTGPVLLVSNHQSMLDPIIVGIGSSHRQFYAMARKTLWNNKLLGHMMNTLNAIPVDQDKPDASTMKRCIDILKQNHALLIFPEGARTLTGQTEPFEPGLMLIIKRAKPTIIPVALEGAYDAWPRTSKTPKPFGRITCQYGHPIPAEDLLDLPPKQALEHLRQTIESLRLELADQMQQS
ncbi:MAG: lysophospholipid acyltransferase family protein [Phycisphaerales bacterium JB063]